MLASLFFTIIASYPVHRPGSKPTLTYLLPSAALYSNGGFRFLLHTIEKVLARDN